MIVTRMAETDPPPSTRSANPGRSGIRILLPVAAVALLAQLSQAQDLFGAATKPIVLFLLGLAGMPSSESAGHLIVGTLEVPWSRDCAGLNLLIILFAVTVWMNRSAPIDAGWWLRVLSALPAALFANVARVLTVVAYRKLFFPAVESPQLHYFIGLAWLVPFAAFLVARDARGRLVTLFELLHAASVLALIAPLADGPGGLALSVAAVLTLAHCRLASPVGGKRLLALALWLAAAGGIIAVGMESFWLPWLLLCPLLITPSWLFSIEGLVLLAGSQPMFQLIPGGQLLTWMAAGYAGWKMLRPPQGPVPEQSRATGRPHPALLLVVLTFCLPFLGSLFVVPEKMDMQPPDFVAKQEIPGEGFQVRFPEQSSELGLFWYLPSGSQRHHTLKVCMKYRGIDLVPAAEGSAVMTDGEVWMREFFLIPKGMLSSYEQYVWSTLGPGKSPGVHLITVASHEAMTADEFDKQSKQLISEISASLAPR